MKTDALKEQGLTQEQIDFVMAENGKDLNALKSQNAALTTERDGLKSQLQTAQDTLKGFEGIDLEKIKKDLADYQKKAEDAEKEYQAKIAERDFSDALNAEIDKVKFTSEAAKRDVVAQIKGAGLKMHGGKILGLSDLIEQIKASDASAFVDEKKDALEQGKAKFTTPMKTGDSPTAFEKMTVSEKMAYANAHADSAEVKAWLNK